MPLSLCESTFIASGIKDIKSLGNNEYHCLTIDNGVYLYR